MPTEKPRVTITVTEEQLCEIEKYRYGKRMKNQTQAILSLIRMGLDETGRTNKSEIEKAPVSAKPDTRAVQIFKNMLADLGIIDSSNPLNDGDLEFLNAVLVAVNAHFKSATCNDSEDNILSLVARRKSLAPDNINELVENSQVSADEHNRHY